VERLRQSTLARHTLFALIAIGVLYAVVVSVSDYRDTDQIAPIAYTACAAAGLTLLVGFSGQI
jgi:hypothetical protein